MAADHSVYFSNWTQDGDTHTYWVLTDQQGTVRDLIEFQGAGEYEHEHVYYSTFGGTDVLADVALDVGALYVGREYDLHSNLYYNRARWYDPTMQRFISEDPAKTDINLYGYCNNSPINATDPSGCVSMGEVADWMCGSDGWLFDIDTRATSFFDAHPDAAEWMAARSDAAIYSAAVVASVPLSIAIFYGAPYLAAAAVAAGPAYFALQAGISGVETGVEYGLSRLIGGSEGVSDFSWTETFGKNFAINSATAGSIGGEALFKGVGYGARKAWGRLGATGAVTGTADALGGFRLNSGRARRTLEEAVQIASRHGVDIPDYVRLSAVKMGDMPLVRGGRARAAFAQFGKHADDFISWNQMLVQGAIPVRLKQSVLLSDEAIVSTLAHEMHEITTLRALFDAYGGVVSRSQLGGWINAPHGSVHQEAVHVDEQIRRALRGD